MGRSTAPKGFYTAAQAIKKLGYARSTFYDMVERGQIKKVVPPNQSDGFYPKLDIDRMAREKELFLLQYSPDTTVFRKAEEKDIQAIHNLSLEIFGASVAPSYESRLAPYLKNPNIYYVVEQDGILVGYLGIAPIKQ